jgi:nucleoside-diphosphate-sugar epimerase
MRGTEAPAHRTVVLFGASGQIGQALARTLALATDCFRVIPVGWAEVLRGACVVPKTFLRSVIGPGDPGKLDVVFANGVTDPRSSLADLMLSNCEFPKKIIEAAMCISGVRCLTLGTVFERFPEFLQTNSYPRSKAELASWLAEVASQSEFRHRVLHVRLHTVYGGPPKPFMFLGQMAEALRSGTEFSMSSGEQLREYHHADDIGGCLRNLLHDEWEFGSPILEINSGEPVRLAHLAKAVFSAHGKTHQLKIGAIKTPRGENLELIFPRSAHSVLPYYRNPILGVVEVLRGLRS